LPPEPETVWFSVYPPQTSIVLPVQIALWDSRALGAPTELIDNQLLVAGSYRPPADPAEPESLDSAPQNNARPPVQTAVGREIAGGASTTDVGDQESEIGSYRPPVLK